MALPTPTGRHWREPGVSRSLPLVVLVLALALSGVLAYQAQDAARSHRAASEGTLRDYGAFASWELGRRVEEAAQRTLSSAFRTMAIAARIESPTGDPEVLAADFVSWSEPVFALCSCPGAAHDFFYVDLSDGRFAATSSRLPAADHEWIRQQVSRQPMPSARPPVPADPRQSTGPQVAGGPRVITRPRDPTSPQVTTVRPRGSPPVTIRMGGSQVTRVVSGQEQIASVPLPGRPSKSLLYARAMSEDGVTTGVYGFVLDLPAFTRSVIGGILTDTPLLPPTLTDGAPNAAVLAIDVSSPSGESIFRSRGILNPSTMVVDTIGGEFGQLVVRVGVRPEIADRLVIGGLPRSRLPLLIGVLFLTLVLGVIAIVQIRRQQEIAQIRSGFVSGVSHELRTPLAQIRLFADLLESGRLGEPQRARAVGIIGGEARRLSYLVENVLRFARSERGPDKVAPVAADVARAVRETVESFAPLASSRGATLRMSEGTDVYAAIDPDAMRQVVLNLLDNAVKYGPAGQKVGVGVHREGGRVRITVDDEGPGIPEADRDRVWQPYFRLSRELETTTGGSGIGLAVVHDLVALHGGTASVEDAPGGGARFVVSLPALNGDAEDDGRPARAGAATGGGS